MDETVTENLRQLRAEVDRLYAEAQAKLREAQAVNSNYRVMRVAAYSTTTLDEFERQYAEKSGVTVEWLHAQGQFGVPCDCREVGGK